MKEKAVLMIQMLIDELKSYGHQMIFCVELSILVVVVDHVYSG